MLYSLLLLLLLLLLLSLAILLYLSLVSCSQRHYHYHYHYHYCFVVPFLFLTHVVSVRLLLYAVYPSSDLLTTDDYLYAVAVAAAVAVVDGDVVVYQVIVNEYVYHQMRNV